MKKLSVKKLSILSLVLIGASAVTAAVLPKSNQSFRATGELQGDTANGGAQQTCVAGGIGNCDASTAAASASSVSGATSDDALTTGANNTGLIDRNGVAVSS